MLLCGDGMKADWIAVDWGTTNLRASAMGPDGVLAEAQSADGMAMLSRDQFEPALMRLISPWLADEPVPVIACGMVGSRQGWTEAPYRSVPCTPMQSGALVTVPASDRRIVVKIVPGLRQTAPADVMRGEETQIAGALTLMPGFDGTFCLPGTHSKWARISAGEVASFQTCMTGELFALLSGQSVLRHSMQGEGWDDSAFAEGVDEAFARPERLAALLFTLRAESLIAGLSAASARARLSGLLIGSELAAARPYWLGQDVVLIGAEKLSASYAAALKQLGLTSRRLDAGACTLSGLATARGAFGTVSA